jgi:hypothetical protein
MHNHGDCLFDHYARGDISAESALLIAQYRAALSKRII